MWQPRTELPVRWEILPTRAETYSLHHPGVAVCFECARNLSQDTDHVILCMRMPVRSNVLRMTSHLQGCASTTRWQTVCSLRLPRALSTALATRPSISRFQCGGLPTRVRGEAVREALIYNSGCRGKAFEMRARALSLSQGQC